MKAGLLFDSTACIGCEACAAACKEKNDLPGPVEKKLTAYTWTTVEHRSGIHVRRLCFHCEVPTCASVCPVGAFRKDPQGPVVYDAGRCIGCRYCIMACPFDVPKYQWDRAIPIVQKCTMCADRVVSGKEPVCASVCPTGATMFGDRDQLVREARARLAGFPKRYLPRIYGLDQVGGTSVLMLSSVPLAEAGLRQIDRREPIPMLTWRVLSRIPDLALAGGALLYGICWITNRRAHVQNSWPRSRSNTLSHSGGASAMSWKSGVTTSRGVGFPTLSFWRLVYLVLMAVGTAANGSPLRLGAWGRDEPQRQFPWGLWIGFDVLCGVGLAAGGFALTATVYVFNLKQFAAIIRPTVLTAFLGYVFVVFALMFDLGQPYRIWHALVMWNPRSVMFEVAWCVMLYTTVLALEFSPVVFERLNLERPQRIIHAVVRPLVIVGVVLSTLHQSSLGSLYLIVPDKLHPLWYSPLLPVFFFISAIAAGLAMVIVESSLCQRAFGHHLELRLLDPLGRAMIVALAAYGILRFQDLSHRAALPSLLHLDYEACMFLLEIGLGVVVPILLLAIPAVRRRQEGLVAGAYLVVLGFIMNRLNVSITGMERAAGVVYFPSWIEVAVSLALVAAGFAAFGIAVRYLPIFVNPWERHGRTEAPPAWLVAR